MLTPSQEISCKGVAEKPSLEGEFLLLEGLEAHISSVLSNNHGDL